MLTGPVCSVLCVLVSKQLKGCHSITLISSVPTGLKDGPKKSTACSFAGMLSLDSMR